MKGRKIEESRGTRKTNRKEKIGLERETVNRQEKEIGEKIGKRERERKRGRGREGDGER